MKHRVGARTPQIEIQHNEVKARVREYLRTTPKSILSVDDILWFFPERQSQKKNDPEKWKWLSIKQTISNFMREEMIAEWEQMWRRRTIPLRVETTVPKPIKKVKPIIPHFPRTGSHSIRHQANDPEPWLSRLARYREVCQNLTVVENGVQPRHSAAREEARA